MAKAPKKKIYIDELIKSLEGKLEQRALDEWPVKALLEFKESGKRISVTKRGNYEQSRLRPLRPSKWSIDELLDWVDGNLIGHRNTKPEDIWAEIYLRWQIPDNYTEDAATTYIKTGATPPRTEHGLLVEDRRRINADIKDLTFPELCSMYLGKIESPFNHDTLKKRIKHVARVITEDHFDEIISKFESGEVNMSAMTDQIIGAFEARKELYRKYGGRVTDQQLAVNTKAIYNSLRRVMKADYGTFAETWRVILKYVDTHYNTLFHPSQLRRGWPLIDLTGGNLYVLDRLLTLIVGTRNPATRREDIRFYKLDYILEHVTNAKERENIIAFYSE